MNPLFQAMSANPQMQGMANLLNLLKTGDPEQVAMQLMRSNPQFKAFMDSVQGMTPEQYCQQHGLDFGQIKRMM